jgi:uncharacterized cupin superfamily protein
MSDSTPTPPFPRPVALDAVAVHAFDGTAKGAAAFAYRRRNLGAAAGCRDLGFSVYEIEPGKRAFPMHWHAANEEAFFVLEGEVVMRLPGGEVTLRAGDLFVCHAGDPSHAHQLRNDGTVACRYISVSTMREPDVVGYPESGKVGLFAGSAPGGDASRRTWSTFLDASATREYLDGEGGGG